MFSIFISSVRNLKANSKLQKKSNSQHSQIIISRVSIPTSFDKMAGGNNAPATVAAAAEVNGQDTPFPNMINSILRGIMMYMALTTIKNFSSKNTQSNGINCYF